jgi:hypothetical protein
LHHVHKKKKREGGAKRGCYEQQRQWKVVNYYLRRSITTSNFIVFTTVDGTNKIAFLLLATTDHSPHLHREFQVIRTAILLDSHKLSCPQQSTAPPSNGFYYWIITRTSADVDPTKRKQFDVQGDGRIFPEHVPNPTL